MPTDHYVEQVVRPLALPAALGQLARCVAVTLALLLRRRLHEPVARVGDRLTFADGTCGRVYRDTVVDRAPAQDPVVLVVTFRMRWLNGRRGRAYFRLVSRLNTVLFAGFPGFVSKLWMAADEQGKYRGLYEWDGTGPAQNYVRALWWPLALISHQDSIRACLLRGRRREDELRWDDGQRLGGAWWDVCRVRSDAQ